MYEFPHHKAKIESLDRINPFASNAILECVFCRRSLSRTAKATKTRQWNWFTNNKYPDKLCVWMQSDRNIHKTK